jgi:hypothetical protein
VSTAVLTASAVVRKLRRTDVLQSSPRTGQQSGRFVGAGGTALAIVTDRGPVDLISSHERDHAVSLPSVPGERRLTDR